ncbi:MAG TPA: hypothetical protein VKI19_01395, partial [Acidimicrobiales bacterium]|nr:hypothetical protein [Acidimicrobiales bacterium]
MVATMVPSSRTLPDVLPTDRLSDTGRPAPALRAALREFSGSRNALTVGGAWLQSFGVMAAAVALNRWWAYAVAF